MNNWKKQEMLKKKLKQQEKFKKQMLGKEIKKQRRN